MSIFEENGAFKMIFFFQILFYTLLTFSDDVNKFYNVTPF